MIETLQSAGVTPPVVGVAFFTDEEGARFPPTCSAASSPAVWG